MKIPLSSSLLSSAFLLLGCGSDLAMATSEGGTTTRGTTVTSSDEGPAADSSDGGASTSGSFLDEPDAGDGSLECSTYAQNCPLGFKCMPWADDDSSAWNATRCFPSVADPGGLGDPCMMVEYGLSGLDDCQRGAMCWHIQPKTGKGTCVSLCQGNDRIQTCEDPETYCRNFGYVFAVCIPQCYPLEQDCLPGDACYPIDDHWSCAPDASDDAGAYGDPCDFINVCDPGLVCLGAVATPDCVDSPGCCSEICDISSPEGDAQCTGAPQGQTCQAWFEEGAVPPGYEDVGACALPA